MVDERMLHMLALMRDFYISKSFRIYIIFLSPYVSFVARVFTRV